MRHLKQAAANILSMDLSDKHPMKLKSDMSEEEWRGFCKGRKLILSTVQLELQKAAEKDKNEASSAQPGSQDAFLVYVDAENEKQRKTALLELNAIQFLCTKAKASSRGATEEILARLPVIRNYLLKIQYHKKEK